MLQEIVDEFIVVPIGEDADRLEGIISLNSTGAFLWKLLLQNKSLVDLQNALIQEYSIDPDVAYSDLKIFIEQLSDLGCLDSDS